MTVFIDTAGTVDPAVINVLYPPVASGCVGYYEFGADAALSLRNLVNPGRPLIKGGAPVFGAQGVTLSQSNYLDAVDDTAEYTRIALVRAPAAISTDANSIPSYLGNYVSGSGGSVLYQSYQSGAWRLNAAGLVGGGNAAGGDIALWRLVGIQHGATQDRVDSYTTGASDIRSAGAYTPVARPVRIGGANSGSPGAFQTKLAVFYSRALTDAERATMADWLAARAVALGVTPGT